MDAVLSEGFIDQCAMASPTQLESFAFGRKGSRRRGILMALIAHSICHGAVHIGEQDSRIIRTMGVMTARATSLGDGVIHMLFLKRRRFGLMTGKTEGRNRILQQLS